MKYLKIGITLKITRFYLSYQLRSKIHSYRSDYTLGTHSDPHPKPKSHPFRAISFQ